MNEISQIPEIIHQRNVIPQDISISQNNFNQTRWISEFNQEDQLVNQMSQMSHNQFLNHNNQIYNHHNQHNQYNRNNYFNQNIHQIHQNQHFQQKQPFEEISQDVWQAEFEKIKSSIPSIQDDFDNQMNESVDWKTEFEEMWKKSRPQGFKFQDDNKFLGISDPFTRAMEMKKVFGDLTEISLLLESALHQDPNHVEAWYELGLVCAENENESRGIEALEECLKVSNGQFRKAMLALGVALVNEGKVYSNKTGRNEDAIEILATWAGLVPSSDPLPSLLKLIDPEHISSDLQVALGLIYYTYQDYPKTISCFSTALSTRPDDYLLWSRLGATMSNSGNSKSQGLMIR